FKGNRLERKQNAFHHASGVFGHSFAEVVWPENGRTASGAPLPVVKGLPTTRTVALYDDPFGDWVAVFALMFDTASTAASSEGGATVWTEREKFRIRWENKGQSGRGITVDEDSRVNHGFPVVPIVRWSIDMDLEGRTTGLVEPLIRPQDDVNQNKY